MYVWKGPPFSDLYFKSTCQYFVECTGFYNMKPIYMTVYFDQLQNISLRKRIIRGFLSYFYTQERFSENNKELPPQNRNENLQ